MLVISSMGQSLFHVIVKRGQNQGSEEQCFSESVTTVKIAMTLRGRITDQSSESLTQSRSALQARIGESGQCLAQALVFLRRPLNNLGLGELVAPAHQGGRSLGGRVRLRRWVPCPAPGSGSTCELRAHGCALSLPPRRPELQFTPHALPKLVLPLPLPPVLALQNTPGLILQIWEHPGTAQRKATGAAAVQPGPGICCPPPGPKPRATGAPRPRSFL